MQTRPLSILVVDDEPALCGLIRKELSEEGFDCLSATDPQEALKLLGTGRFSVLIADVVMPKLGGLDLSAQARRLVPACKVILMTGASKREYLAQALMLGAYDYIPKPFSLGELVELVKKATTASGDLPQLPVRAAEAMELAEQTKRAALDSVRALVRAIEAKDPYTRRHSEQVTLYAVHLARCLGLAETAVEQIRVASLLHDVGKIGVPDAILTKPGKLTDQEFEHIRSHPALGAEILSNVTLLKQEAQLVRHHHEAWDGGGYPDGLAGEEILLGARIMNIADSMDAMLMERSYKTGYAIEKMLDELSRCAGTQFDPRIVAAAGQWCRSNPQKLMLPASAAKSTWRSTV